VLGTPPAPQGQKVVVDTESSPMLQTVIRYFFMSLETINLFGATGNMVSNGIHLVLFGT
jgi:hypothetical protein